MAPTPSLPPASHLPTCTHHTSPLPLLTCALRTNEKIAHSRLTFSTALQPVASPPPRAPAPLSFHTGRATARCMITQADDAHRAALPSLRATAASSACLPATMPSPLYSSRLLASLSRIPITAWRGGRRNHLGVAAGKSCALRLGRCSRAPRYLRHAYWRAGLARARDETQNIHCALVIPHLSVRRCEAKKA